jgi:hypothetical protein
MKRILIILGHNRLTGVNTWAYTLGDFLIRSGHVVDFEIKKDFQYQHNTQGILESLDRLNANIFLDTKPAYDSYDYCIVNYNLHQKFCDPKKTIFVSHGSMDELYKPFGKVHAHVAISGRTKEILNADVVIHNGIDLKKFVMTKMPKSQPKMALNIFRGIPNYSIYKSCEILDIQFEHIGGVEDVAEQIKKQDFIIGYGRSAYEGMAAGKPVLVHGVFGTDGWIRPENFEKLFYRNCSGWAEKLHLSLQELTEMLKEYKAEDGPINRGLAEKYLSAELMTTKFEELF